MGWKGGGRRGGGEEGHEEKEEGVETGKQEGGREEKAVGGRRQGAEGQEVRGCPRVLPLHQTAPPSRTFERGDAKENECPANQPLRPMHWQRGPTTLL